MTCSRRLLRGQRNTLEKEDGKAAQIISELVERGYYSSISDFARQSILDKLINDLELGILELEPDLIDQKQE